MTNVSKLRAQVKAAQKLNAKKITAAAEIAMLNATLKLESSKELFASKVSLAVKSAHTKTLKDLINDCSGIIDSMPVQNQKSRTIREWAGSRRFTFGNQINLMFQLATGIMYSCAEHKELLLAHTGLDSELLEQFAEAFGSPAYYSRNNNVLVESKPFDIEAVQSTVTLMQSMLFVVIDTSQLTESNFKVEFTKGEIRAHEDTMKANEAISEAEFTL